MEGEERELEILLELFDRFPTDGKRMLNKITILDRFPICINDELLDEYFQIRFLKIWAYDLTHLHKTCL